MQTRGIAIFGYYRSAVEVAAYLRAKEHRIIIIDDNKENLNIAAAIGLDENVIKIPKLSIPHLGTGPVCSRNAVPVSRGPHPFDFVIAAPVGQYGRFGLNNIETKVNDIESHCAHHSAVLRQKIDHLNLIECLRSHFAGSLSQWNENIEIYTRKRPFGTEHLDHMGFSLSVPGHLYTPSVEFFDEAIGFFCQCI